MEPTRPDVGLVFIAGTGRCGSTLLDLLLGGRPDVSGLGELYALCAHPDTRLCGCGRPVLDCPYWQGVARQLHESYPEDYPDLAWRVFRAGILPDHRLARRFPTLRELLLFLPWFAPIRAAALLNADCRNATRMVRDVFRLVAVACARDGTRWAVDSSKHAKRMKTLYLAEPGRTRIVHLVRDGRAAAGRARRLGEGVEMGIRRWRWQTQNILRFLRTVPAAHAITVHYEALCDATLEECRRLDRFLGLEPYEGEHRIARREWHNIPGNPLLFSDVAGIKKDERWKHELTSADLRLFDRLAGSLNRRLGYD